MKKNNAWSAAKKLAERTPDARNRYVDFLRAVSISVVVIGHWLVAAPHVEGGELKLADMLHVSPWTQWLTLILQVMPVFFIVGGYSNAASLEAARREGQDFGLWFATRLRRLVGPVVPLVITWSVIALIALQAGVRPLFISVGSEVAFTPTWFLAVYVMVIIIAPATYRAWKRFGMASFWGLALGAVIVDAVAFANDLPWLRWVNYAFVWLGVHQLGYAWRAGRIGGPKPALLWAAGALGVLLFLVVVMDYPISMITVPGEEVSNSRPPTLALFALGVLHFGLLLAVETPVRRWLSGLGPWTATVLVNGTIMTLYLWHVTAMVLMVGLANLLGGIGLAIDPGTGIWWASRPIWLAIYAAVLFVFIAIFGRFEQTARVGADAPISAWRAAAGAVGVCAGLATLALVGISVEEPLAIPVGSVALVLAGAALVLGPPLRRTGRT